VNTHEEPQNIGWQEFRNTFCTHHIPQGMIKLKRKEFQDLREGSMSVNVDTDEKKQDCFLNGLNDGFAYALEAKNYENF
jgi:hypothetical protein